MVETIFLCRIQSSSTAKNKYSGLTASLKQSFDFTMITIDTATLFHRTRAAPKNIPPGLLNFDPASVSVFW
jgi:hypothetical protein